MWVAMAQTGPKLDPASAIRFSLAPGAPVSVVSTDLGSSRVEARGGAMVLDLHAMVTLRNDSAQNIRGVTLLVLAQEMTPGGKGSVAVPSSSSSTSVLSPPAPPGTCATMRWMLVRCAEKVLRLCWMDW